MAAQAQGYCGRPMKYKGMMDVLRQAVQKEGVRGLYKVSPAMQGTSWMASEGWNLFTSLRVSH